MALPSLPPSLPPSDDPIETGCTNGRKDADAVPGFHRRIRHACHRTNGGRGCPSYRSQVARIPLGRSRNLEPKSASLPELRLAAHGGGSAGKVTVGSVLINRLNGGTATAHASLAHFLFPMPTWMVSLSLFLSPFLFLSFFLPARPSFRVFVHASRRPPR